MARLHWHKTALTQDCHEQFRRINLHWHDLRHEYASRLIERGVPLSQVRDVLGHASIVTTERYDNQQMERLQVARASWNRASSSGTDAGIRDRVSHFFHNPSAGRDSGTGHYNRGRP
jgi:hypothetical protein